MICKNCGKKFRKRKKLPNQLDCSEGCLVDRWDKVAKKSRGLARWYARSMGYRSIFEVRFKALCNFNNLKLDYEVKTVPYHYKEQHYTADFSKKRIHLECKGVLDQATRKKLVAIKRCNPTMDLRLVFERPNNKLNSKAKWRYWEWAEKRGFKWYDWKNVKDIKKDLVP